jgi:hypothetical protein
MGITGSGFPGSEISHCQEKVFIEVVVPVITSSLLLRAEHQHSSKPAAIKD